MHSLGQQLLQMVRFPHYLGCLEPQNRDPLSLILLKLFIEPLATTTITDAREYRPVEDNIYFFYMKMIFSAYLVI